jgi:hypothetical protein
MACPLVMNGEESLQIWRVFANVLNKQLQTDDKGWSSSWRLVEGLTTPHHRKPACYRVLNMGPS